MGTQLDRYRDAQRPHLKAIPARARDVLREYRASVEAVNARWDLTPDMKSKGREIARNTALRQVTDLKWATRTVIAASFHALRQERRRARPLTATDTAAWDRLRPLAEAAVKSDQPAWVVVEKRLAQARADGDEAMLEAARRELPDFLNAAGQPLSDDVRDQLDLAAPDPEIRAATVLDQELRKGSTWIQTAVEHALYELQPPGQGANADVLPTFEGTVIPVTEQASA